MEKISLGKMAQNGCYFITGVNTLIEVSPRREGKEEAIITADCTKAYHYIICTLEPPHETAASFDLNEVFIMHRTVCLYRLRQLEHEILSISNVKNNMLTAVLSLVKTNKAIKTYS